MKKNDIFALIDRLFIPLLLCVLGLILLVNPDSASALVAKVLGWGLMIAGIGSIIAALTSSGGTVGKVLSAILCFGVGGWLLRNPLMLAVGIGRLVGVVLLIRGIRDIAAAGQRGHGRVLAIVTAAVGVVLIVMPMTTSRLVLSLCGLVVLIVGACMLIDRLKDHRRLNEPEDPNIIDAL